MSRNVSRAAAEGVRKKRRRNSILWSVAAIAIIVVLLLFEQVALLYLLATLGVAVLLTVVAFADLHGAQQQEVAAPAPADDAAAIADAALRPAPSATFRPTTSRPAKRRRKR
jgi:hypothetical protein